jgi:hypothetical protein
MTNGSIEVITSVQRRRWSRAEQERIVAATGTEPAALDCFVALRAPRNDVFRGMR